MLVNFYTQQSVDDVLSQPDTLAVFSFDQQGCKQTVSNHLENIDKPATIEVWQAPEQSISVGQTGDCYWRRSDDYQFFFVTIEASSAEQIEQHSEHIYQSLLNTLTQSDYPNLIRFWNFLPHINFGAGDTENYKRFCTGRLKAFNQYRIDEPGFPAATAVGHYQSGITVCGLSSKQPQQSHISNPRQQDPYQYPRQYGPTSPSFARATVVNTGDNRLCFVSGTSSIIGHNTVHQGNILQQYTTTVDNITCCLDEAGLKQDDVQSLRVYLRNPDDYSPIKQALANDFKNAQAVFSHADICRADLLVEIECFASA